MKQKTFLGAPMSWKKPTAKRFRENMWNRSRSAPMFPPKFFGIGWSFNFAYPLIKTKPLWKRTLAFLFGLFLLLAVMYVLIVIGVVVYYRLTPNHVRTITLTIK